MNDLRRYSGRACWVRCSDGWELKFNPELRVPARHRMDFEAPYPPELGGPCGWFDVEFDFVPIDRRKNV